MGGNHCSGGTCPPGGPGSGAGWRSEGPGELCGSRGPGEWPGSGRTWTGCTGCPQERERREDTAWDAASGHHYVPVELYVHVKFYGKTVSVMSLETQIVVVEIFTS